jgi:hypothetical protein
MAYEYEMINFEEVHFKINFVCFLSLQIQRTRQMLTIYTSSALTVELQLLSIEDFATILPMFLFETIIQSRSQNKFKKLHDLTIQ